MVCKIFLCSESPILPEKFDDGRKQIPRQIAKCYALPPNAKTDDTFVTEAVVRRCSVITLFSETAQNSQENTCPESLYCSNCRACNFILKDCSEQ